MKKQKEEAEKLKSGQEEKQGKKRESCAEEERGGHCGCHCHCSGNQEEEDGKCDKEDSECQCGEGCCKDAGARVEELEREKKALAEALAREKDDYVRLMAEFETFRRRSAEEKLSLVTTASADTIKGLLPVLDDCERALELLSKSSDEAAREGTGLIYDKLMKYLRSKGLEVIDAKGKKFDTDFHEAVAQVPVEEDKKGLVYDVVGTGYLLGGKILRYAKVVVGI